jgi:cupin fold WbuC family metalloprotein
MCYLPVYGILHVERALFFASRDPAVFFKDHCQWQVHLNESMKMNNRSFIRNKAKIVDQNTIELLKLKAKNSEEGKARLCLHKDFEDPLQEMVIVHTKYAYIRPHKHEKKDESISVIEGRCLLVFFDEEGRVKYRFILTGKRNIVCRIEKNTWHSMVILSDYIVFHEVVSGPFMGKGDSIFPRWAPSKDDKLAIRAFIKDISKNKQR